MALVLSASVCCAGRAATNAALPSTAPTEIAHGTMSPARAARERNRPKVVEHFVDINSAPRKELMTLPGVGAAEADKIIANRPYLTKTELVSKGVIPTGPFLSLRNQVVAMQPGVGKARPPGKVAVARADGSR